MFIIKPHYVACETFKREDMELNETIKQILEETRSKLEELNYKAIIISIIK